jgi:RecA/RadA recombinase
MSTSATVAALRDSINKAYGEDVIVDSEAIELTYVPTGIFSIDLSLGGISRGRVGIIVGNESTCKSTVLYMMAGNFQRVCGNCMKGKITEKNFAKSKLVVGEKVKRYWCDNKKRNLYCPGERVEESHKLPAKVYTYDLECSVCTAPEYSTFVLVDSEQNYTRSWAQRFGVVHGCVALARPQYSEQVGDIVRTAMDTGKVSFIGIDSLDAQGPKEEDEASVEDQQMGIQARVWNKITRALHSKLNKRFTYEYTSHDKKKRTEARSAETAVVIVQQWRQKIGISYGNPNVMGGGLGKNYAASWILAFSKGEKDWRSKEDKDMAGIWFNFEVSKSKISRPYRYGRFYFSLDALMIQNENTVLDYAVQYEVVAQSGAWYSFGKERWQGRDKVLVSMKEDRQLMAALQRAVVKAKELEE